MRIDILTLFPEMFRGPFEASIIARAVERHIVTLELHNLRDWGEGRHLVVDDAPYGGGAGMVLKPEPIFRAVEAVQPLSPEPGRVVLLTPQGRLLTQAIVDELAGDRQSLVVRAQDNYPASKPAAGLQEQQQSAESKPPQPHRNNGRGKPDQNPSP